MIDLHRKRRSTARRSPKWPALEKRHLKSAPHCAVCGTTEKCVPHHIAPVHIDPSRELDPANLITLCPPHHLLCGHLMLWAAYNPDVVQDCAVWQSKIAKRRKAAQPDLPLNAGVMVA